MRTLFIGALAACLAGCSRQPSPPSPTGLSTGSGWVARLERTMGLSLNSTASTIPAAAPDGFRKAKLQSARGRHGMRFATDKSKSTKFAQSARPLASHVPPTPASSRPRVRQADNAAASNSKTTRANIAEPQTTVGLVGSKTIAGDALAAASTSFAEQATPVIAATTPDVKTDDGQIIGRQETLALGKTEAIHPAPDKDISHMVAVLMARSDIVSVLNLTGKTIAIDEEYFASNVDIRTAIVAAGGSRVKLSESQTSAMSRLVNGEVSAAVLALVSPDAAGSFPAIPGFTMFNVPLSPRALAPLPPH
jgi:hypothetical protein